MYAASLCILNTGSEEKRCQEPLIESAITLTSQRHPVTTFCRAKAEQKGSGLINNESCPFSSGLINNEEVVPAVVEKLAAR